MDARAGRGDRKRAVPVTDCYCGQCDIRQTLKQYSEGARRAALEPAGHEFAAYVLKMTGVDLTKQRREEPPVVNKAATAVRDREAHVTFPIFKFDRTPDGDIVVYGRVTDGTVDADHQKVDPKWSGKALTDWLSSGGNMRVQHSPFLYPAGKGLALDVDRDGDGGHWLKALIVEDTAKKLVEKGVLKDFSVGIVDPRVTHGDYSAPGGTIVGGQIGEVSLVDRGSNKNTTFQIVKSVGGRATLVGEMNKARTAPRAHAETAGGGDGSFSAFMASLERGGQVWSVKKAIEILKSEGLVRTVIGRGIFVARKDG